MSGKIESRKKQRDEGGKSNYGMLHDELAETYIESLSVSRTLSRLALAQVKSVTEQVPLHDAYKEVVIQDKQRLLDLLEWQLKDLKSMKTPKVVLEDTEKKLNVAKRALQKSTKSQPKRLLKKAIGDLESSLQMVNLGLSTSFVHTSAYRSKLKAVKKAVKKLWDF